MSSNAPPAGPRRRHMREKVCIGSRWRYQRDGSVWRCEQVWRTDRLALMRLEPRNATENNVQRTVRFSDLQQKWEQVGS